MKSVVAAILLFHALASGAAGAEKRTNRSSIITANYDDQAVSLLPTLNGVTVYKGLSYSAWSYIDISPPTSGSIPQSPRNAVATTLLVGQLLGGTPSMTVAYHGSKSLYFDLLSFFFNCVTPTGTGAAQLAVHCSILVGGFDATNKEVASATYTFTPPLLQVAKAPMIQAILPDRFKGLRNVTVVQTSPANQVLLVDDYKYRLYTSS